MKKFKIVFGALALAVVVATVFACTKDGVNQGVQQNVDGNENSFMDLNGIHVKVQHDTIFNLGRDGVGWLYFQSKNDYESLISAYSAVSDSVLDSFENTLSFSSMRSSLTSDQREAIEIEDDLLAMMLSPSGIVQVGDYVFGIDVVNDTVLVYNQVSPNARPLVFSVDDDVFDVLEGNKDSGEKGCSAKNKETGIDFANTKIGCKVVYQKAGIYFSLQSKIKKHNWGGDVELHLTCLEGTSSYKRNGDSNTYLINECTLYGLDHSYHYRPYSGIKKLVNFHFSVDFNAYNLANNTNMGWRHMQINCGN